MSNISFIGIGNMGTPMVLNLLAAGHQVKVYDVNPKNYTKVESAGAVSFLEISETIKDADFIITMLPQGEHAKTVYMESNGVFAHANQSSILIDCSTIDIETSKLLHQHATEKNFLMFDAPVSGGTAGAKAASLTFMVGGNENEFSRIQPLLSHMGKNIFFAGAAGAGQAAKTCNNLMLAVHMIGTAEGLSLGKSLGLDPKKLYEICNHSSGQSWSLSNYCPMPDIMPNVPSSNNFKPGFMARMMLKDLKLAEAAAANIEMDLEMMKKALALYQQFCDDGNADMDFSGIISELL